MPNPKTQFLQMEKPIALQQALDLMMASRLDELDGAIGGYVDLSLTGLSGNVDLDPVATARKAVITLTGAPTAAVTVRIPATTGAKAEITFVNKCTGTFSTATIKSTGTNSENAAGVVIPTGKEQKVRHNGNSAFPVGGQFTTGSGLFVPAARVYHSVNQSIPNNAATVLGFDSERFDTDAIHDTVTNNSRLTCNTAGKYLIVLAARFAANATGYRAFYIRLNGIPNNYIGICTQQAPTVASVGPDVTVSAIWDMAVNDYVEAMVGQDSSAALNVIATTPLSPEFQMARIG